MVFGFFIKGEGEVIRFVAIIVGDGGESIGVEIGALRIGEALVDVFGEIRGGSDADKGFDGFRAGFGNKKSHPAAH